MLSWPKEYIEEDGIVFEQVLNSTKLRMTGMKLSLLPTKAKFRLAALLYATGPKPNIEPLHLENTDIALTERGGIQVNKHLKQVFPVFFAVGDVNGGPQFPYFLYDFRIVFNW